MPVFSDFVGAIFDVDDTLLDNRPRDDALSLHEQSRFLAAHEVGKRLGIKELEQFTGEQCIQAFVDSKVHSTRGVVWQMLIIAGIVSQNQAIDFDHPILEEVVRAKERLHEALLRTKGQEVPGAAEFVGQLARAGLKGRLAIASTATLRDIDIFLKMAHLDKFFPKNHIISHDLLTHPKPHPEAFNLAFATLGLPESARVKVLAFEDDPRGVMSAKAAGLYVCAITTVHKREDLAKLVVPPDLIADSYAEFARLLALPGTLDT
jgi:beta-phosphoglucomutase-like phosphatase (HAD superfamily)